MRIALTKLGYYISWNDIAKTGNMYEVKHIIEILHGMDKDIQIDIYSEILDRKNKYDGKPDYITFYNILDQYKEINNRNYDCLIVINGNMTFFGGEEYEERILCYNLINNFKGKIIYIHCDNQLVLKQCWRQVKTKPWAGNWDRNDIHIKRDDIVYISQMRDLKLLNTLTNKGSLKVDIKYENLYHFPFEKFPCLDNIIPINNNLEYDLIYGGTIRANRRLYKMLKFHFGYSDKLKVTMFGNFTIEKLKALLKATKKLSYLHNDNTIYPTIEDAVSADEYTKKINKSLAQIVICDKAMEGGKHYAQRIYQSIWANNITFIDVDVDPNKEIFKNSEFLKQFNYVSSTVEIEKKLIMVKNTIGIREKILEEQFKAIGFNKDLYLKEFKDLFLSILNK